MYFFFFFFPSLFFIVVYHAVVYCCLSWVCILFYLLVCLLSFSLLLVYPVPCEILKSQQRLAGGTGGSVLLSLCPPSPCPSTELKETRRGQAVPKVGCCLSFGRRLGEDQTVSPAPEALATCGLFADPAGAADVVLWS